MGHKEKKSKESKDRKHRKKHKKEKRRDKSHRSRHSSDSSSSEDERLPDINTALQMGRAAARALREILAYNYELRGELRQLARHLDGGNALDISGIPDEFLLSKLRIVFDNLTQLRKTSAGHYLHRSGTTTILSFVAPFLEETPASLASYAVASQPVVNNIEKPQQVGGLVSEPLEPNGAAGVGIEAAQAAAEEGPPAVLSSQQQGGEEIEGMVEDAPLYDSDGEPPATAVTAAATAVTVGPVEHAEEEEEAPARRVLGPAMPPAELLAAAAAMEPGPQSDIESEEEEEKDEFVVGPPPPEYLETDDLASMDQRTAEVTRILNVLREHEASAPALAAPGKDGAGAAPEPADAYTVLDVATEMPASEIKKRYWKLSLLIHPDKCDHPQAERAFQAVAAAAAELQDSGKRAGVDARRKGVEDRKEAAEFYAHQERERQWRIARGEATPQDLAGPAPKAAAARDTWMTHLPPERVASAAPPTGHQRTFSAKSSKPRQGAEQWTMTPQDRALMLEGGGTGGPMMLEARGGGGAIADGGRAARTSAVVDAYNSSTRGKSLLETHMEKKKDKDGGGGGKKRKKARDEEKGKGEKSEKKQATDKGGGEDWDRSAHPWRPFDREKDLEIKPSGGAANPQELLKNMKGLNSRFGGSSTGRSFL